MVAFAVGTERSQVFGPSERVLVMQAASRSDLRPGSGAGRRTVQEHNSAYNRCRGFAAVRAAYC